MNIINSIFGALFTIMAIGCFLGAFKPGEPSNSLVLGFVLLGLARMEQIMIELNKKKD